MVKIQRLNEEIKIYNGKNKDKILETINSLDFENESLVKMLQSKKYILDYLIETINQSIGFWSFVDLIREDLDLYEKYKRNNIR